MAKEYLEKLVVVMEQATTGRFKDITLECKHFFSGAAVYADGRICISLTPAGFAIKLPVNLSEELLKEKGTKQLRYFAKAPIKKDYIVLPETILNDMEVLRRLVKVTIEYALTLPKPTKKNRGVAE